MKKKEMIAMLLAGGQGSRLGILTKQIAKPAVMFGGKYRIIDFPLSNCINSGIDTVGVLTQYEPLLLTRHIGIGIPWDLDRRNGGVTVLPPFVKGNEGSWYSGTANAIYHNIRYIDEYNPEYVLILSGDHVYKMDYSAMLEEHKKNNADATIAVIEVPMDIANQFGIMNTNEEGRIIEFEEKPEKPKSKYAVPGLYFYDNSVVEKAKALKPSPRGELEITDLNRIYMEEGSLKVDLLGRGMAWLDTGTHQSMLKASNFVEAVQTTQGTFVACLEEIAYRQGWISKDKVRELAGPLMKTEYGKYLIDIIEE